MTQSEPAHLLDIMHRHDGFAAIICLIGQGQEIHDGEGGMACWGDALASRPEWQIHVSPDVISSIPGLTTLPPSLPVQKDTSLHLTVPVRSLRDTATPKWVNAALEGNTSLARSISKNASLPFRLTRSLPALRKALRERSRLTYRCGLIASSQAKRLRAEGLGAELAHMDSNAVAQWFLNRWIPDKDVRASDALETVATQFAIQGLELDFVGLCWDGDLIRTGYPQRWQSRRFSGTTWQTVKSAEKALCSLNTYRVLLTRARYETIIWVPEGNPDDPTRCPDALNEIADFLLACGIEPLKPSPTQQAVENCLLNA
ncbi:DNA/RNA helicase domain-containing protein [Gluconobacter japonicus]|uniref:DNA/RNA helicase domain-containing protein n=1 Tax=Gluconobacter japonicus TaxID=376620 RepID=UPI001F3D00E5|nr:DNA/RNA helicase domain-containing protein [Gluconobacter japonicus]